MRLPILLSGLAFLALAAVHRPLLGQQEAAPKTAQNVDETEAPLFRAGVALVRLDVQVVDKRGQSIIDLTKDDFVVLDESQPQEISYFAREAEPLDLLLLLDISGSMKRSMEALSSSAQSALKQLQDQDRVGVMYFSRRTEMAGDLTSDFKKAEQDIRAAVSKKPLGSGTLLNPSMIAAAQRMGEEPVRGRRSVLVVTDNQGLNYQVPDEMVIQEYLKADSVLNAIVVRDAKPPEPPKGGRYTNPDFTPSNVFAVAESTGGETLREKSNAFPEMIDRIRSRYSLQYPAPEAPAGTFRRVMVELSPEAKRKHPNSVVRVRSGYTVK